MEEPENGVSSVEPDGNNSRDATGLARIETLRIVVAIVIVAIWAIIYLRAAVDTKFSPPPELSGVMLLVVAWLFGTTALRGKK